MLSTYTASATFWDWFIALTLLISSGMGFWRGFIRTGFGLGAWILGFLLCGPLAAFIAPLLSDVFTAPIVVFQILAFVLVYLLVQIGGQLTARGFRAIGLGGLDRFFGMLLGAARAVVIITVAAMLAHRFGFHTEPAWQMAHSRMMLDALAANGFALLNQYQPG
ncbi:MAG: CvpA family protein [Lautropia sp.]|nr:CvpA family protein [Lautropia sp.]